GRLWAMRQHLIPSLINAEVLNEEDVARILRHARAHNQVEELANTLISRARKFRRKELELPSLEARPMKDTLLLRIPSFIDSLVDEAIEEAGGQVRNIVTKQGHPAVLPPGVREVFQEMDEMIRAPFHDTVGARMRSSQEVIVELMQRLEREGISSTLVVDPETRRVFLGMTVAEHADQVFASIYRKGWANRDTSRAAWVELPTVSRGGILTGGKLSRPVGDIVTID